METTSKQEDLIVEGRGDLIEDDEDGNENEEEEEDIGEEQLVGGGKRKIDGILLSDGKNNSSEIHEIDDEEEAMLLNDEDDEGGGGVDVMEAGDIDEDEDDALGVVTKKFKTGNGEGRIIEAGSSRSGGLSLLKNIQSRTTNGDGGSDIEIIEEEEEEDEEVDGQVLQNIRGLADGNLKISLSRNHNSIQAHQNSRQVLEDDDDIMEIANEDPLFEVNHARNKSSGGNGAGKSMLLSSKMLSKDASGHLVAEENTKNDKDDKVTIVVNDTKSLVDLAHSKKEPGKEPTLVIIDTNAILSGKGPVPLEKSSVNSKQDSQVSNSRSHHHHQANSVDGALKYSSTLPIPDDAFLIEAPSFIVPYVFEQPGDKSLRDSIANLEAEVKKAKQAKVEKGEQVNDGDDIQEYKKPKTEDYFEGPVGRLLMNVGMNLVQEFVQVDLLKMQKRKAEKEKEKNRGRSISMQTQQSILSLKKNIEESKENNEPFRFETKKCQFCNFKTESELVMAAHLETPHMRNYSYRCNFCEYTTRIPHEILFHMEAEHFVMPRLERAPAYHQCPNCSFEDNSKAKLTRHLIGCTKRFKIEKNLEPPLDWDTPAKLPKLAKNRLLPQTAMSPAFIQGNVQQQRNNAYINIAPKYIQQGGKMPMPPLLQAPKTKPVPGLIRTGPKMQQHAPTMSHLQRGINLTTSHLQMSGNQILQQVVGGGGLSVGGAGAGVGGFLSKLGLLPSSMGGSVSHVQKSASMGQQMRNNKPSAQPSISITPLPRQSGSNSASSSNQAKQTQGGAGKTSFVICEICDGYIKDLDQLRNHMQWIHKVKIHPKMIYNKPPLNCQKCQFRFFTDQGLERHLLGSHGLVTSSMQDAANKGQDSGRCPLCGKVYQWKLLAHVAKDHDVTLKPAHLSYKCTVCTATFGMYKLFESHVYSAHSMTAKKNERRPMPPANSTPNRSSQLQVTSRPVSAVSNQNSFKAMKINDEITIIPQPLANSNPSLRNKGSLTITPQGSSSRRSMLPHDDDGIQIIEIDDAPSKMSANGRNPKENGEFRGRLPISDSTLRKRNLEISVCGTDSDNNSSDDTFRTHPMTHKRLRTSNITIN